MMFEASSSCFLFWISRFFAASMASWAFFEASSEPRPLSSFCNLLGSFQSNRRRDILDIKYEYIYIYVQCTWRGINIYVYIAFAVYLHMCTLTVPTYKTAIVINIIEYNWHVRGCFLKNCMLETSHERTHVAIHIFCIVLQHDPCSKHLKSTV